MYPRLASNFHITKDDLELLSLLSLPLECWDYGHNMHNTVHAVLGIKSRVVSRVVGNSTKQAASIALASGLKAIFIFLGYFACLRVRAPQHAGPTEVRRGIGAPRVRVRDSCELPRGWWESNLDPLEEQQVFFTNYLSLASVFADPGVGIFGKKSGIAML